MYKKIIPHALLSAFAEVVYIAFVATLMINGERLFGPDKESVLGPMVFLLLFVISALISGILILGKPVMLFLDGSKKQALTLLGTTLGFLIVFLGLGILVLIAR